MTLTDSLINVDFDNTLTTGDCRYWAGERPEVDEAVAQATREAYYNHAHIVVWTARPWSEASSIAGWLTRWEIPYHGIRAEKGSASLYVDDKAVRPEEMVDGFHEEMLAE
jgi:phosphoserine phosphatase